MGRKSLGASAIYKCLDCGNKMKRAIAAFNKKPCTKCESETIRLEPIDLNAPKPEPSVSGQQAAIPFKPGSYSFKRIGDEAPKVGDRILYLSVLSGSLLLSNWSIKNQENIEEYKNCLWLGPLMVEKICAV